MSGLWAKAQSAATSAKALLDLGDYDGAINRAYYAVFCAARAALTLEEPDAAAAQTHAGLGPELGRVLSSLERARLSADYDERAATTDEARDAIADMETFLQAIDAFICSP
jgi:uncharacterized protein (UPF0332 family)